MENTNVLLLVIFNKELNWIEYKRPHIALYNNDDNFLSSLHTSWCGDKKRRLQYII